MKKKDRPNPAQAIITDDCDIKSKPKKNRTLCYTDLIEQAVFSIF